MLYIHKVAAKREVPAQGLINTLKDLLHSSCSVIAHQCIDTLTIPVKEPQNLEMERNGSNLKNLAYQQQKV